MKIYMEYKLFFLYKETIPGIIVSIDWALSNFHLNINSSVPVSFCHLVHQNQLIVNPSSKIY